MAEVKQKSGPFSLPLKKKPPSFNNNGVSSSFKHIYDDVFGTSNSSNVETTSSFMEDDYAEIFGSSNSSNGSWSIPYSSVPILELERDKGVCSRRGERVDYGGVFGGFDNGDGFDFGLPDGEVLFNQLKKKAKTSSLNDLPRSQGQSIEATRLESPSQSYDEQLSANGFPQLFDNKKHLDPENDKVTVKTTSRPRKAAHVRVYSYHEPVIKDDSPATDTSIGGKKGNHYRHTSLDLGAQSSNTEAGLRKSSSMSVSNIVDASNGGSQPNKAVTNGFDQSPDCTKHSENEMNETSINRNSVETHTRKVAHVRVYSLHEPVIKDDSPVTDTSIGGKKGNHYRHTSLDLGAQSSNTKAGLRKASGMNVSLVDASNGGSQPSKAVTNGFDQSPDNTKSSENEMIEISINKNSVKAHTPEVHPISESTHSLHEVSPSPDNQPSRESNHSLNELDSAQETVSSKTSVLNEPQITNDVNLVEEQKKQSCNTGSDLDYRLNDNCDGTFQKPCGLTESTSVDNSVESCEASCASGPSYMVKDDVSVDRGKVKKKGRRSRMASVDLGDYKHSSEQNDGLKRKPRLGGSYSFDASHDPCAARVKVHSSMMHPSSSLPRYFPVENRYKISENSTGKCFQRNWDGGAGDSPPSLLEELDVNSDAAISAAMLQRAIEEAELRIRMAKAFLQREGQDSNSLRFKDTLKVRVSRKSSGVVKEVHKIKQTKVHEWFPPVEAESEQKKPFSPLDRKHAVETTQRAPSFEDEKKCVKDEKLADRKDVKVPNLIAGDDKREGEWEAAKHFNQLISGVKNKLASFISWQTETEKKDAVKEMEATMEPLKHLEEIEHDFNDLEAFKRKRTEPNEGTSTSSYEGTHGVNKLQFVSEAVEPEDQDVVSSFNARQEKTENRLDSTPATTSLANFQFFAFRNHQVCDSPDQEVEEREPLETRESEMVNGQEQVMDEEEIERIPFEGEEASQEESDDKCVTQDSMRLDDTSQSNDAGLQNEKLFEEPCSLTDHNVKDISVEEVCQGNTTLKDDLCSISRENIEMVEDHYSRARHDKKEPTHEEEEQDCMSAKSSLGSINEEIDELVEQSSSFAGHDEKELPYEDDRQNDMYMFSHVGSCNEENKEMEGFNQAGHERGDVDREEYNIRSSTAKFGDEPADNSCLFGNISQRNDDNNVGEMQEEAKNQHANEEHQEETCKNSKFSEDEYECQEIDRDQRETNHFEEVPEQTHRWEDIKQIEKQTELIEETAEEVNVQESCVASADEGCKLSENVFLSKSEESCKIDATSFKVEAVYCDEKIEIMDMTSTSEPEIDVRQSPVAAQKASGLHGEEAPQPAQKSGELIEEEAPESTHKHVELTGEEQEPVLSSLSTETDTEVDMNEIKEVLNGTIGSIQHENIVSLDSELDLSIGNKGVDVKAVDLESQCKLDNQTLCSNEAGEDLHLGVFDAASDQDVESSGIEAFHRRRRWFNHGETIATAELPSILEGKGIELEIVQEVLDESEVAGSVEVHADKLDSSAADVTTVRDEEASSNPDIVRTNVETTPTRRKWFVKEGKPEPVSLFKDIKVNLEIPLESMNNSLPEIISDNHLENLNATSGESLNAMKSNVAVDGERGKQSGEAAPRRKRWFESGEHVGTSQQVKLNEDVGLNMEVDQESKAKVDEEQLGKHDSMPIPQEMNGVYEKEKPEKESRRDLDEVNRRGKEKEKERIAVERAIREARERAFAEAKERARRHVADSPNVEARPKVAAGVQEKLGKVSSDVTSSSDKASVEAKLKAERAAVERATAEARERALQKALSEKGSHRSREQGGKYSSEKNSSLESNNQSSRGSDSSNNNDMYSERADGAYVESAQRRKARLERQTRTMERAAKALEEKNRRDLLAQKEQAAKNMMADSLDADVKRWCTGKEGNLRALLSTLQYVLGPESGWQPVSLTDLVASTAVRKAYKKATLCVHPDKLQQRGATIQQKYICEKVFDLLKIIESLDGELIAPLVDGYSRMESQTNSTKQLKTHKDDILPDVRIFSAAIFGFLCSKLRQKT